jgi:glycosyltransferase involved in cell wall biosynthesis
MFLTLMPKANSSRPHLPMGFRGASGMVYFFLRELLFHLPAIWRARQTYQRALRTSPHTEPWIACVSDNLDEINGIALASRVQLRELRRQGRNAFLFGVAFHTREARREDPDQAIVLAPGSYSVDQAGYSHSELAVVRLDAFLDFLREHPVDIIEFQTPGPVMGLCLIAAKIIGIKTLSHYRTDIMTYSEMLMKHRFGKWFVQTWTKTATRLAGPVIVPSETYRQKVAAMGIADARIHKLPRGVDLAAFHPRHRDRSLWRALGIPEDAFCLLYVGRVSAEKNLTPLADAFLEALQRKPSLHLIVIGDGPFREELERHLRACDHAHFTGVLNGEALSQAFASADLFVFPSLTDTFGNSVIEALASGLPCLVSDEGGPREIVQPGVCGEIFHHQDPLSLRDSILSLANDPKRLERYCAAARLRAEEFTYENSAQAFWNLYTSLWKSPSP